MARGRGEGSVSQRSDGLWEGKLSLGVDPITRVRIRRTVYAPTKTECLRRLSSLRVECGKGYLEADKLSVPEFLERWLVDCVEKTTKPRTQKSYRETVTRYLAPAMRHLRMADLRPTSMDGLIAELGKMRYEVPVKGGFEVRVGVPAPTAHYACVVFKIAVRYAVRTEVIERNPFSDTRLKGPKRRTGGTWTAEEARRFLDHAEAYGDRLWAFYVVAALTGLRHGELLALRWADIDLKAGTMSVQHTLREELTGGKYDAVKRRMVGQTTTFHVETVKSEASNAVINIPPFVVAALKKHRERRFADGTLSDFVFVTSNKTHYLQTNVTYAFGKSCDGAGVPRIRIHDMRHTCATLLREAGESLDDISAQLRHGDKAVTQRYAHVTAKATRGTAATMEGIFGGGGGK